MWKSECCKVEKCAICGCEAEHKVEQCHFGSLRDEPIAIHPLTAYLCDLHFRWIMGERGVDLQKKLLGSQKKYDSPREAADRYRDDWPEPF